ncbi:MAG: phosphomannomutase/phosphoglucomutase, partial [Clostridia bacterium]|nr:phosphomannomutase/phosphoglucomutase [Clostridia bacterium]
GAVMVTASHHPKEKNGLKFYTPCGGLGGQEITRLLTRAAELPAPPPAKSLYRPVLHDYAALLLERVRRLTGRIRPLQGKRILVDAGGGAGGFFAIDVLAPLGADVRGSLRLSPDGTFSGRDPNPEKEEALHGLREAVCRQKADLGIAFDPDGDRVALVDRDGDLLHRNRLIALVAATLAEQNPGGVIVTDSVTSDGLPEFLAVHGLHHRRFKRGYKNVIDEAKRHCAQGHNAPHAMETSGHPARREHWFLDDGAYLAARLLASLVLLDREGKALGDLVTSLREPAESAERRIALTEPDFHAQGSRLLKALAELVERHPDFVPETENHEGLRVRVNGPHRGWFLLRASLHDPVLVLNLESDSEGGVRWMEQQLASLFEA